MGERKIDLDKLLESIKEQSRQMAELRESQKETDRQLKESKLDVDRQLKESKLDVDRQIKETDRQLKESKLDVDRKIQETDRQIQETHKIITHNSLEMGKAMERVKKQFGRFNNMWGELVESLVSGDLIELLQERGIEVEDIATRVLVYNGKRKMAEFDIVALNGEENVLVEVKSNLKKSDIDDFISKLPHFRYYRDYKGAKVYGAVAFLKRQEGVEKYAAKNGLFVIRATGDSAVIVNQKDFKPKSFYKS